MLKALQTSAEEAFDLHFEFPEKLKSSNFYLPFHRTVYRISQNHGGVLVSADEVYNPLIIQKRRCKTFPHVRPHPNTQPQAVLARGLVRIPPLGCFMEISLGVLDPQCHRVWSGSCCSVYFPHRPTESTVEKHVVSQHAVISMQKVVKVQLFSR